ncbi:branched-chain amino acid ABC transporter permease [bacterium]|nr:branched-chain amino acid ABC transporter permease [bacterium]
MKDKRKLKNLAGGLLTAVILLVTPLFIENIYWISLLVLICINILLTSSIRIIWLTGEITLGHTGFMLIGAYTSSLLMMRYGFSFWFTIFCGAFAAGVIAFILAFPYRRIRGIYFTILTVLTAESFRNLAYNWREVTGGRTGLFGVPSPGEVLIPWLGTVNFGGFSEYYYLTLFFVSLSLLILYLIENSRYGLIWKAIKEASILAGTVGINVIWYNVINFAIAGFFAGLAGALFAHFQHTLSADPRSSFGVMTCIYLVVYMVVGGEKRFIGGIIGVICLTLISEFSRSLEEYQPMLVGAIAIAVVIAMPEGFVGIPNRIRQLYSRVAR